MVISVRRRISGPQGTYMRRGTRFTAAGRSIPGPSPFLALPRTQPHSPETLVAQACHACVRFLPRAASAPTISNRHTRKTACRAGCPPPTSRSVSNARLSETDHANAISNRHLVRLEITATLIESATSLIDPKQHNCAHTQKHSSETLVAQACPACVRFCPSFQHNAAISNRHLVQLEFTATLPESTTSLFLIDTKQHIFSRSLARISHRQC